MPQVFKVKSVGLTWAIEDRWFVDAVTECGKRMRYTVLGTTPFAMTVDDALGLVSDLVRLEDRSIDDESWVEEERMIHGSSH